MTQKIKFEYKLSNNYSVYAINGAHGGLSPKGEIIMNVFFERQSIPKSTTHEINENGTLGREIDKDQVEAVIRQVLFGLAMSPDTAKAIAVWLNQRAEEFEKIVKRN